MVLLGQLDPPAPQDLLAPQAQIQLLPVLLDQPAQLDQQVPTDQLAQQAPPAAMVLVALLGLLGRKVILVLLVRRVCKAFKAHKGMRVQLAQLDLPALAAQRFIRHLVLPFRREQHGEALLLIRLQIRRPALFKGMLLATLAPGLLLRH